MPYQDFGRNHAIDAQWSSPLGYGLEFIDPEELCHIFTFTIFGITLITYFATEVVSGCWRKLMPMLSQKTWKRHSSLVITKEQQLSQTNSTNLEPVQSNIMHGYRIPVPLYCVWRIPGAVLAPLNIIAQHTIEEHRQIIGMVMLRNICQQQSWCVSTAAMHVWTGLWVLDINIQTALFLLQRPIISQLTRDVTWTHQ